ncbi:hypothetical protein [Parerythrobacter lacustris]|uniref:Uncharacterized protein n=1 Tax=Parerythrobacter lacustris TaxID=2969984 RepID=A0ABT1XNN0_9SPHN|nr:hypothetical protein [Parerythrobacter lacustris]MCR2833255.1 hypothetical protein [Parerythrobacter lacustris]
MGDPPITFGGGGEGAAVYLYRHIMEWAAEQSPQIAAKMVQTDPALNRPAIS